MFKCDLCPSTFSRKDNLKRHSQLHGTDNIIKCIECTSTFTRVDALRRHYEVAHNFNKTSFKCNFCEKEFSRRDNLKRHKQNFHSIVTVTESRTGDSLIQVRHDYGKR